MQAVVKTPHISIRIEGEIPKSLLLFLKRVRDNTSPIWNEGQEKSALKLQSDWQICLTFR